MHFSGPIVRPQTDADSLFIEVTVGCTHNSCRFCNFYEGVPFRMAKLEDIESDLKEAKGYLPTVRKIWANGGNPFVMSTEKQIRVWELIKRYYPEARLSTYAIITDFRNKTVDDIRRIKASGLDDLVIGIESGDDEVLEAVDKGYKSDEIIEACRKLDEAGLDYRMIYLGGLAGAGKLEASAKKSAAIINQIHPYYMYLTTVSVLPGTPLYRDLMEGKFKEATEKERIKEMRELIADVNIPITVNSENAASSVNFTVDLPTEKPLILNELDKFLANFSDDAEKAMSRRRHYMRSV